MSFEEYISLAPSIKYIHYWDLPQSSQIKFKEKNITIKRFLSIFGKNKLLEKSISGVGNGKNIVWTSFPINLRNIDYVKLYALMVSEGSSKSEFGLHVPEEEFHELFENSLINIFDKNIKVKKTISKGFPRSRSNSVIRHLIPIPLHIPKFILQNKNFSKEYLRIAFEAEGSPIFVKSKRYVKLARSRDITNLVNEDIPYKEGEKIYFGQIKEDFPKLAKKLSQYPPETLLGEHYMLLHHFGIYNIIKPEALSVNKTTYRRGKISLRWVLYIYSDALDKFIGEIKFISKRKQKIVEKMRSIRGRRRKFSSLEIVKKISKNRIFKRKDFIKEMKKLNYVSPQAYLWRYERKELIKRIGRGLYKIHFSIS